MPVAELTDWLEQFSGPEFLWFVKRLSGNDTLATHAHQAGPYIPKEFLFDVFPNLNRPDTENPDLVFPLYIDSHADRRDIRAIWYNNRLRGGTRSEARLTGFGGAASALLDPDSTGALTVFAFGTANPECHVWVCQHETEEEIVEDRIGPVEPGKALVWSPRGLAIPEEVQPAARVRANCWLTPDEMPAGWLRQFPSGEEIIRKTVELRADNALNPDRRLLRRRECEYEIFRSVEEAVELPLIRGGFGSIDEFIARAQTILQRRKSRSGRSLELHAKTLFVEEGLMEGTQFVHQPPEADAGKRGPDFLFPSRAAYADPAFPPARLRMLAVKTTCKDRWRQILTEADRITTKHLLTLQEGVSERQFQEMTGAGVQLVVPEPLKTTFPASVQEHLQTLESFIADVRLLNVGNAAR
jgi:EcoRII C terminal/Restriction endonuclease EcoRII, N-terminal